MPPTSTPVIMIALFPLFTTENINQTFPFCHHHSVRRTQRGSRSLPSGPLRPSEAVIVTILVRMRVGNAERKYELCIWELTGVPGGDG